LMLSDDPDQQDRRDVRRNDNDSVSSRGARRRTWPVSTDCFLANRLRNPPPSSSTFATLCSAASSFRSYSKSSRYMAFRIEARSTFVLTERELHATGSLAARAKPVARSSRYVAFRVEARPTFVPTERELHATSPSRIGTVLPKTGIYTFEPFCARPQRVRCRHERNRTSFPRFHILLLVKHWTKSTQSLPQY